MSGDFGGEPFLNGKVQLFNGDSREVLKALPDNSIDSVVTDPPYALVSIVKRSGGANAASAKGNDAYQRASTGFMGKQWDTGETAFAVEFWAEVMRVLKPGGHVVAASGTRTYHRLAVAIEDAGFEIRDMISWLYGSGFPKSHDVSKGIDKSAGAERKKVRVNAPNNANGSLIGSQDSDRPWRIQAIERGYHEVDGNEPATPQAQQWQGWGTALKPACEPWVLARKPLIGTVAANVLAHGVGALNIDGCRVGDEEITTNGRGTMGGSTPIVPQATDFVGTTRTGRFPANVIHDGSDEVVAGFPETGGGASPARSSGITTAFNGGNKHLTGIREEYDSGSAARFFYSAKADKMDRAGSKHPTVKPVDLMQYLCRLVTPPGGIVLDPFAGSGSTGEAAWREGFRCVLIEREADYAEDIRDRLRVADQGTATKKRAIAKKKGGVEPIGGLFAEG